MRSDYVIQNSVTPAMASKQLLLHIGTGKTGTTSIQESLHRAAADGILGDICYPVFGSSNHNLLSVLYMPPERLPREYRSRYQTEGHEALAHRADDFREQLFQTIQESHKTIISAEYLGRFGRDELHALRTDLDSMGVDDIGVVAYIREPPSAYLSFVQQTLKASSTFRAPAAYHYSFRSVLEAWSEEFSDLIVRPFVRDGLAGGDIVSDFAQIVSSFFRVDGGLTLPTVTTNQSVSAEAMIVLQRYRQRFHAAADDQFKWDSGQLLHLLQQSAGSLRQTPAALLPSAAQVIVSNHHDDLEWLSKTFGVQLPGGSTKVPGESGAAAEPYDGPRYLEDVAEILASYDAVVVGDLLLHCLRRALVAQRSSTGEVTKMRSEVSELKSRLKDSRREAALAHRQVQQILASRSWRWGRRMVLILSSPLKLIRAYCRT